MKILLLICCLLPAWGQVKLFPVGGRVVEALSGQPVPGIRMVLALESVPQEPVAVGASDSEGRFAFRVAAGRYQLRAERLGLPPQQYLQPALNLPVGSAVIVGGKENLSQLTFRLLLPSAISGLIKDEDSEPVDGAEVWLIERRVVNGMRYEAVLKIGNSDDRGMFRFGNLSSGLYSLAVVAKPWYAGKSLLVRDTYAPAFHPASEGMTPIVLGAGAEVEIPIKLRSTPSALLESVVPKSEARFRTIEQELSIKTPEGVRITIANSKGYVDRVRVAFLAAGEHESALTAREGDKVEHALDRVSLASPNTTITQEPKSSPPVTVRVEAAGALPGVVSLTHFRTGEERSVGLGTSGEAEFRDLPPGLLRFSVSGKGLYLDELIGAEGPLLDGRFELAQTPLLLQARVKRDVAKLRGIVRQDARAAAGVLVAIVPVEKRGDTQRYRSYQTNSDGSYEFENLPPGEYGLIVSENMRLEYADPKLLTGLLEKATRVSIGGKAEVVLDLEAKP